MGNTPSHQHGGHHSHGHASPARQPSTSAPESHESSPTTAHAHRHPNLRLPMPRPHISPQSSNPTSPSGSTHNRSGSPRRRKSLELPDLNKLSFTPAALTPAAPVPTTHTHTSHHLAPSTPAAGHVKAGSGSGIPSPTSTPTAGVPPNVTPGKKWHGVLGGRTGSPLANVNHLGAMSRLDQSVPSSGPGNRSAPVSMPNTNVSAAQTQTNNPYFPSTAEQNAITQTQQYPTRAIPIPIPGKDLKYGSEGMKKTIVAGVTPPPTAVPTPPPANDGAAQPPTQESSNDGMVNVPIQWNGGGKVVYVTGNFADNWKGRIKLHRSTHDFNTILRLPPGQYRLKFIVDDSWRCSKQISTATDDDGTLVNWIEVEAPKTEEELKAEWAMDSKPAVKQEENDESQWTNTIPPALTLYQYIEELPHHLSPDEYTSFLKSVPYLPAVPPPPTLPRILDKVIVNNDTKRLWDSHDPASAQQVGWQGAPPAGLDDNSILAVPNHVVLNHLTASAIRNGTLGVGTTTRYRKKYITTMFFKPTLADMPGTEPIAPPVQ
ncbi:hypothetical protein CI109_106394 [Kwoniella shandongensis]|uniref:Uncharacterized protein n=1 Tax=Kwoniella shandongensis TaxID=1734106 RepID=A0A5M6BS91_9TREE|nr:uncharacterized protein CI109_005897 [Kwoniella shandongensis]KAA5525734.1 hypothetical protein CI109_005897 [Kwoniella shandongensis]